MTSYNLPAERILLQKIAYGDELAFKQIFELYRSKIYSFVIRFVHSKADAEEIVQNTFFIIWQKRAHLPNIAHPRNYIYTIVRNKTYDYLNQASKNKHALAVLWANMQIEHNDTQDLIDLKDSEMLIKNGLANLSEQKQLIFKLSRVNSMSHDDIATHMGLSKSRIKNVIVDILKYLRRYLALNSIKVVIFSFLIDNFY